MKKPITKQLEDSIREEALLLRHLVHEAKRRERRARVLSRSGRPSGRMRIRFKRNETSVELVGA